jgi:hypothetical protein
MHGCLRETMQPNLASYKKSLQELAEAAQVGASPSNFDPTRSTGRGNSKWRLHVFGRLSRLLSGLIFGSAPHASVGPSSWPSNARTTVASQSALGCSYLIPTLGGPSMARIPLPIQADINVRFELRRNYPRDMSPSSGGN